MLNEKQFQRKLIRQCSDDQKQWQHSDPEEPMISHCLLYELLKENIKTIAILTGKRFSSRFCMQISIIFYQVIFGVSHFNLSVSVIYTDS